jgi:multiple sugar transport system permease protein
MSVHKWKPVQSRYLGTSHYEKALGDLTSALLVLAAFAVMIGGVWLLTRDWRNPLRGRGPTLVLGVIALLLTAAIARGWQLHNFIDSYEMGAAWASEIAGQMFFDRRGDPTEQIALLVDSSRAFLGAAGLLFAAAILLVTTIFLKLRPRLIGCLAGVLSIYAAGQVVSVGWTKMMAKGDTDFLDSLIHTVFYCIGTITIQVSLGLVIAFALYRKLRGFAVFRFVIFLPYVVPVVAMATVFRLIFGARESSLSNQALAALGIEPLQWIADSTPIITSLFGIELSGLIAGPSLGMVTVILFGVFSYTGYNAVILLAGLTSIPGDLYEAAELEGATAWQTFRHITMPLLSPVIFFLVITGLIGTFQAFTHIYIMLGPIVNESIHTGVIMIWRQIEMGKFGYASALAVILFVLIILLTIWQFSLFSRHQEFGE